MPLIDEEFLPMRAQRETYYDKGLTFKCRHFDPVPAQLATGVRARDLHAIEYTTDAFLGLRQSLT